MKSITTGNTVTKYNGGYVVHGPVSPVYIADVRVQDGDPSKVGRNGAGAEDLLSIALDVIGCISEEYNSKSADQEKLAHIQSAVRHLCEARQELLKFNGVEPVL